MKSKLAKVQTSDMFEFQTFTVLTKRWFFSDFVIDIEKDVSYSRNFRNTPSVRKPGLSEDAWEFGIRTVFTIQKPDVRLDHFITKVKIVHLKTV